MSPYYEITHFLSCLLPLSCEEKPLIYDEEWHESEKKIPTPPRIHEELLGGVGELLT
jgi:hypothetical protein